MTHKLTTRIASASARRVDDDDGDGTVVVIGARAPSVASNSRARVRVVGYARASSREVRVRSVSMTSRADARGPDVEAMRDVDAPGDALRVVGYAVKARRVCGADVGPVRVGADATVGDLRRAVYDAEWLERERGAGDVSEIPASEKPPSAAHVMILCDGRMLGPDEKTLEACGLRADGRERVLHVVTSSRAAPWSEDWARGIKSDKAVAATSADEVAVRTQPSCCSVM